MQTGEVIQFPRQIHVTRRVINRLASQVLIGNSTFYSSIYRDQFTMDLFDTPHYSYQALHLGHGVGKSPEQALVRSLYTARRVQVEGGHPTECIESEIGRIDQDVTRESRLGHIAAQSDIRLRRLRKHQILASSSIGYGPDGDRPFEVPGPGVVTALQNMVELFDFDSRYYSDVNTYMIERLPLTSFDHID